MYISPKVLKREAAEKLGDLRCKPGRIVMLSAAVSLGASLLVSLLQLFISTQTSQGSGLDGLETLALWNTVSSLLDMAVSLLSPVWSMGLVFVALQFARGEESHPKYLTAGFHRFGRIFGLILLALLLAYFLTGITVSAGIVAMVLFVNLDGLAATLQPFEQQLTENSALLEDAEFLSTLPWTDILSSMVVPLVLMVALTLGLSLLLSYFLRLGSYYIMDTPGVNPALAMIRSCRTAGKHFKTFLMLDLSFWWYYLLTALLTAFSMIPSLPGMGWLGSWGSLLWYTAYALGLCALFWWKGAQVETAYALAYDKLKN